MEIALIPDPNLSIFNYTVSSFNKIWEIPSKYVDRPSSWPDLQF